MVCVRGQESEMYTAMPWAAALPATIELTSRRSFGPALPAVRHAQHVQVVLPGCVLRVAVTDAIGTEMYACLRNTIW